MVRHCGQVEGLNRFFVHQSQVRSDQIQLTDRDDLQHIIKVLRLGVGDEIEISDNLLFEYQTRIQSVAKDQILLEILDKQRFAREPETQITLYQGVPKAGKLETIIQKSVELGVHTIVPVYTARSVPQEKGGSGKQIRWQKIAEEAAKQCKRGIIPTVREGISWKNLLREWSERGGLLLFPYENETMVSLRDVIKGQVQSPKEVSILIGPEGGFSEQEAEEIQQLGGKRLSLGKTILRTETAAIVAIALVLYELE